MIRSILSWSEYHSFDGGPVITCIGVVADFHVNAQLLYWKWNNDAPSLLQRHQKAVASDHVRLISNRISLSRVTSQIHLPKLPIRFWRAKADQWIVKTWTHDYHAFSYGVWSAFYASRIGMPEHSPLNLPPSPPVYLRTIRTYLNSERLGHSTQLNDASLLPP